MNWGGFAGGFSQGFNNGVAMGKTFKSAMKDHKLEKLREEGIAEANAARAAEVDGMVTENPASQAAPAPEVTTQTPVAEGSVQTAAVPTPEAQARPLGTTPPAAAPATPAAAGLPSTTPTTITPQAIDAAPVAQGLPKRFSVGKQSFDTREEALAAADKIATPINDLIYSKVLPRQQQFYIEHGDLDKAEAIGKYMESKRGKDAAKTFGTAMTKMLTGDTDGGIEAFGDYYNKYIDDGVDFKSHKVNEDGSFEITVRQKGADKDTTMNLTRGQLIRLGMAHDPVKMGDMFLTQQQEAEKQAAELAKENRQFKREVAKDDRNHAQQKELKKIESDNRVVEKTIDAKIDAGKPGETAKKIRDLREFGWDDERISGLLDKDGEFKKSTSQTERRALVTSDLMKNEPGFSRLPADKQKQKIDQTMALIYGDEKKASPAAGGLSGKGQPLRDTKTGQIVYRGADGVIRDSSGREVK